MSTIRKATKQDLNFIKSIIESTELFPAEMLEEMMLDYFTNPSSLDTWLVT